MDIQRYDRQLKLKEFGREGQERLARSRVLVIGAGGLGSPVLMYLVGAGVGRVTFVDFDIVDVSNLHRQVLHSTKDLGRPKVESGLDRLSAINPEVELDPRNLRLTKDNACALFGEGFDVAVDATDGFANKFLVNDAAVESKTKLVCGGVVGWEGQVMSVDPGKTACYRCLFGGPPEPGTVPTPDMVGLIGTAPAVLGAIQASEAFKILLGCGNPLYDRLLVADLLSAEFRTVQVKRDPNCAACGSHGETHKQNSFGDGS